MPGHRPAQRLRAGVPLVTVQGYGGGVFIEPRYKLDKTLLSGPELEGAAIGAALEELEKNGPAAQI